MPELQPWLASQAALAWRTRVEEGAVPWELHTWAIMVVELVELDNLGSEAGNTAAAAAASPRRIQTVAVAASFVGGEMAAHNQEEEDKMTEEETWVWEEAWGPF